MTNEEIDKLDASEELDELVACEVMGWIYRKGAMYEWEMPDRPHPPGTILPRWHHFPPAYSRKISAAWQVVEKINANGYSVWLSVLEPEDGKNWDCTIGQGDKTNGEIAQADAGTAPLAICRAALKATLAKGAP